jgi:hypothetical protein
MGDILLSRNNLSSKYFLQGALGVGALVVAGDKFLLGEQDLMKSIVFGGAVALGTYAAPMIAEKLKIQLAPKPETPDFGDMLNAASLDLKIKQYGGSAVSAVLINTLFLKKNFQISQLAVIGGSHLIKEYAVKSYMAQGHNAKHQNK